MIEKLPARLIPYLAAGAVLIILGAAVAAYLGERRIDDLQQAADAERKRADLLAADADQAQAAAERYKEKIEYLEERLGRISAAAAKQDEEIKNISIAVDGRRDAATRARGLRSIQSTAAELCRELAELGHPCE